MGQKPDFGVGFDDLKFVLIGVPDRVRLRLYRVRIALRAVAFIVSVCGAVAYVIGMNVAIPLISFALFILLSVDISSSTTKYKHSTTYKTGRVSLGSEDPASIEINPESGSITTLTTELFDPLDQRIDEDSIWTYAEKASIKLAPADLEWIRSRKSLMVELREDVRRVELKLDEERN